MESTYSPESFILAGSNRYVLSDTVQEIRDICFCRNSLLPMLFHEASRLEWVQIYFAYFSIKAGT